MWSHLVKNYQAWAVQTEQFPQNGVLEEQIRFLLRYAILAPSSHNSQPWRFFVSGNTLDIDLNKERTLPVSDPTNRLAYIGLGAALENILTAADYFGFKAMETYFPNGEHKSPAIRISFVKTTPPPSNPTHRIHAIVRRRSNRGPYMNQPLPESFVQKLTIFASGNVHISYITEPEMRMRLVDALMDARLKIFDHVPFRKELVKYKRNNLTRSGTGMPGFTMGFPLLMSFITPLAIRLFNVIKIFRAKEEKLLKVYTPFFFTLGTGEDTARDWMDAGKCLQKILLEAEHAGIHSSIAVFPRTPDVLSLYQSIAPGGYHPHMFCRLGFSHDRPRHSPRLLPEEL